MQKLQMIMERQTSLQWSVSLLTYLLTLCNDAHKEAFQQGTHKAWLLDNCINTGSS